MPFFNPYMKNPDYGSGIADYRNKLLQLLVAMMGGGGNPLGSMGGGGSAAMPALGPTSMPPARPMGGMQMFGGQGANATMFGPGQAGTIGPGSTAMGGLSAPGQNNFQITPEMIQRILALLNAQGGQFGGGGQKF